MIHAIAAVRALVSLSACQPRKGPETRPKKRLSQAPASLPPNADVLRVILERYRILNADTLTRLQTYWSAAGLLQIPRVGARIANVRITIQTIMSKQNL